MIDHVQSRAIPAPSSAIVFSALITTCGLVIAAFIQTGWMGKPSPAVVVLPQPSPPIAPATFTGAIEPLRERPVPAVRQISFTAEKVVAAEPILALDAADTFLALRPAETPPTALPVVTTTTTLASPWHYLKDVPTNNIPNDSPKSPKKPNDWRAITRFFQGRR